MTTQLDLLPRYPHAPGYKAPGTSQVAAETIAPFAKTLREQVYELLQRKAATADEAAMELHRSVLSIRPRLSELHREGKIRETGKRRLNQSGMSAAEWEAVK